MTMKQNHGKNLRTIIIVFSVLWVILFLLRLCVANTPEESNSNILAIYDSFKTLFEVFGLIFIAIQFTINAIAINSQIDIFNKQAAQIDLFKEEYRDKKNAKLRCTIHNVEDKNNPTEYWTYIRFYNVGLAAAFDITLTAYYKDFEMNNKIINLDQFTFVVLAQNSTDVPLIKEQLLESSFERIIVRYKDLSSENFKEEIIKLAL